MNLICENCERKLTENDQVYYSLCSHLFCEKCALPDNCQKIKNCKKCTDSLIILRNFDIFSSTCSVCLKHYTELNVTPDVFDENYDKAGNRMILNGCGHSVCFYCINKLLKFSCPTCRNTFTYAFCNEQVDFSVYKRHELVLDGVKTRFFGQLKNGLPYGWGIFRQKNLYKRGTFKNGILNGFGLIINKTVILRGIFVNDKLCGLGIFTDTRSKNSYFGRFDQNQFHGKGVYCFKTNKGYVKFKGSFVNGLMSHGVYF